MEEKTHLLRELNALLGQCGALMDENGRLLKENETLRVDVVPERDRLREQIVSVNAEMDVVQERLNRLQNMYNDKVML